MAKTLPKQDQISKIIIISFFLALISPQASAQDSQDFVKVIGTGESAIIFLDGEVNEAMATAFYKATDSVSHATVILQSPGGYVEYGLNIAARIAIKGYATAVIDSSCASMCSIIWLAGERRYMTDSAEILVHAAYKFINQGGAEIAAVSGSANAEIGAFLGRLGLSREAIRYVTSADPNEAMNPITPSVANVLGIDFILASGESLVRNPVRSEVARRVQLIGDLLGLGEYCQSIFDLDIAGLRSATEDILDGAIDQFGASVVDAEIEIYSPRVEAEISRNNQIRWCLLAEGRVRLNGADSILKGPSYDCRRSEMPTEYVICGSRELWAYDQVMANLYFFYKRNSEGEEARRFLQGQRNWISLRNLCRQDEICLLKVYSNRILEFGH